MSLFLGEVAALDVAPLIFTHGWSYALAKQQQQQQQQQRQQHQKSCVSVYTCYVRSEPSKLDCNKVTRVYTHARLSLLGDIHIK